MKTNIHNKIAVIFITITAAILLGVFLSLSHNLQDYTYNRIKTNVTRQIRLSKSYIEDNPLNRINSYDSDYIADKIGKDLDLRVTIIGLDGTVYGDSELEGKELIKVENHLYRPEVQQAIQSGIGESRRFSTTIKKDFLYIASLFNKGEKKGIIRLSIPLSDIEHLLNRLRYTLATSLLAAFILSALVSYSASLFISRPIREISRAAKDIADGDYSKKISLRSEDEIGDLSSIFNHMAGQVKSRIGEVNESKSRLEAVLLSMFEGVMVVDSKGSIILINQPLKNVLKIEEEPSGKRPIEAIRNLQIQEIADNILHTKEGLISEEITILLPVEKTLLVHATPVKKGGKTEGAVLVFHDVTNLRRLEKVRQDFVANVSHELRTPISSIIGYAETLLDGALRDEENATDFLNIILTDSNRLATLIDDLLSLAKIESGKIMMEKRPCQLLPIAEQVLASLKGHIEGKEIKIKIDIPENIPSVSADETRIKQVLLNLIDNAVKYNIQGGKISISADETNDSVKVNISDTGIGIPRKDLPRLFERFYRVDKARSRELGGTGLGLSIVKHIIHSHNGEVSVQSVEGEGSTFSFSLPKA
ncbi:MAG: ATP-binding protein [Nitrospinota bacterium]|nr:cell wall metabolism sensor histidine kinase WalK [Nitrospinota bacterium]